MAQQNLLVSVRCDLFWRRLGLDTIALPTWFCKASVPSFSEKLDLHNKYVQCNLTSTYRNITIQVLKSGRISREISRTSEIDHLNFEVGSRKSEVGSRKSEVGTQKSELRSRNSEVRSRKSEVGTQKSEIRSRKSEVGTQESEVPPGLSYLTSWFMIIDWVQWDTGHKYGLMLCRCKGKSSWFLLNSKHWW